MLGWVRSLLVGAPVPSSVPATVLARLAPDAAPKPAPMTRPVHRKVVQFENRKRNLLEQHTPKEHAKGLLVWVCRNFGCDSGSILWDRMQEFYAEFLQEAGWHAQPWSGADGVGRNFDLLTTGGTKPYEFVTTATGRRRKARVYRIPTWAREQYGWPQDEHRRAVA